MKNKEIKRKKAPGYASAYIWLLQTASRVFNTITKQMHDLQSNYYTASLFFFWLTKPVFHMTETVHMANNLFLIAFIFDIYNEKSGYKTSRNHKLIETTKHLGIDSKISERAMRKPKNRFLLLVLTESQALIGFNMAAIPQSDTGQLWKMLYLPYLVTLLF
jgi:hypothetical protein